MAVRGDCTETSRVVTGSVVLGRLWPIVADRHRRGRPERSRFSGGAKDLPPSNVCGRSLRAMEKTRALGMTPPAWGSLSLHQERVALALFANRRQFPVTGDHHGVIRQRQYGVVKRAHDLLRVATGQVRAAD